MAGVRKAAILFLAIEIYCTSANNIDVSISEEGVCSYGPNNFSDSLRPKDTCARLTCLAGRKQILYETCERGSDQLQERSSESVSSQSHQEFPYCCESKQNDEKVYYPYISTTYHLGPVAGITTELKKLYVNVAKELWTCKSRKPEKGQPMQVCCQTTYDYTLRTATETRCPVVTDFKESGCVLISTGQEGAPYPKCCPEYLCPPAERYCSITPRHKEGKWSCEYRKCGDDVEQQDAQRIYSAVELTTIGCKTELPNGNSNQAQNLDGRSCRSTQCPDIMCPKSTETIITVPGGTTPAVARIEYLNPPTKICQHERQNFQHEFNSTTPCQQWTCKFDAGFIEINKCGRGDLEEHCKWSDGEKQKPFPNCCDRRICERRFTRYLTYV